MKKDQNSSKDSKKKLSDIIAERLYLEIIEQSTSTLKELDQLVRDSELPLKGKDENQ